jgi:hypothetical protein
VSRATTEPLAFTAGDSVTWERAVDEYSPEDGWALTYIIRGPGATLDISCTTEGDVFVATLSTTNTTAMTSGRWDWQARVSKAAEKHTIDRGVFDVEASLAVAGANYDARSFWRKVKEAIESSFVGQATAEFSSLTVEGKTLTRFTKSELLILLDRANRECRNEDIANGVGRTRTIVHRFRTPGF